MCFWESRRTTKDGTLTICLPTLGMNVSKSLDYHCRVYSPNVALTDEDTGVVDRLRKTELVDTGLKTTLQEIFDLEGQDVIELHAGLIEDTDTDETTNKGVSFEQTLGVLLVEGQKLTVAFISLSRVIEHKQCDKTRTYRAARRILDSCSCTRHTSRLLRSPYSPTIFNSESLPHS